VKYQVTRFKSLKVCLKELEPFIRNGQHIETGKPFKRFGELRSRELLANWLLCVAVNSVTDAGRLTFTSDPLGGDGIIYDTTTEETWPTEHVLVPRSRSAGDTVPLEARILKAIEGKQSRGGAAYASGKTLVVFLNAGGDEPWVPNMVARQLPALDFLSVWVVGLQTVDAGAYVYSVTRLDLGQGNAPVWRVRIGIGFDEWKAEPVQ
jgi:hypothetical protein